MQYRLIGDVHGKYTRYKSIIKGCDTSIQVGDFGVGFKTVKDGEVKCTTNPPFDTMSEGNHRFIRGNHDNLSVCVQQKYWIPDGSVIDDKMFLVGGATSIDKQYRIEGLDWWPDEECSDRQFDQFFEVYSIIKPKVVISHECPEFVADDILKTSNKVKYLDYSKTRVFLEKLYYIHQPDEWYFGHWHYSLELKYGRTFFRCLNELEYIDITL